MHNFRRYVLIPIAIGAVLATLVGTLKVIDPYKIPFICAALLLATFASFSVDPPSPNQEGRTNDSIRRTLLNLVTTLSLALALLFGGLGYSGFRVQQEKPSSSSLSSPSGTPPGTASSSLAAIRPTSLPTPPTTNPVPGNGQLAKTRVPSSPVEDFIQKYVDGAAPHRGGQPQWAVLISGQDHEQFPELNAAASAAVTETGYRDVPLFRPSLVRDGKLDEIYDTDPELIRKLGEICDGFIVAKANSSLRQDTTMQGIYTEELSVQVRVIQTADGLVRKEFTISEKGAGFTSTEAEANARVRAAKTLKEQLRSVL